METTQMNGRKEQDKHRPTLRQPYCCAEMVLMSGLWKYENKRQKTETAKKDQEQEPLKKQIRIKSMDNNNSREIWKRKHKTKKNALSHRQYKSHQHALIPHTYAALHE